MGETEVEVPALEFVQRIGELVFMEIEHRRDRAQLRREQCLHFRQVEVVRDEEEVRPRTLRQGSGKVERGGTHPPFPLARGQGQQLPTVLRIGLEPAQEGHVRRRRIWLHRQDRVLVFNCHAAPNRHPFGYTASLLPRFRSGSSVTIAARPPPSRDRRALPRSRRAIARGGPVDRPPPDPARNWWHAGLPG